MSRLAFAAGRGARIQFRTSTNRWIHSHSLPLFQNNRFRIHPDDAQLTYGVVSTYLRDLAEDKYYNFYSPQPSVSIKLLMLLGCDVFDVYGTWDSMTPHERRIHLALVAEYLADEGY